MSQKNLETLVRMGPPGAAEASLASQAYLSSFGLTFFGRLVACGMELGR